MVINHLLNGMILQVDIQMPPEVRCFRSVFGVQIPYQEVFGCPRVRLNEFKWCFDFDGDESHGRILKRRSSPLRSHKSKS